MWSKYVVYFQIANHYVGISAICLLVTVPILYTFGVWAEIFTWPVIMAAMSATQSVNLVPYLGYAGTIIGLALLALVPGSKRVLLLERSHRNFHVEMQDVQKAFYLAFQADRRGMFLLTAEFDATRERFEYLKSLPELINLEPDILLLAAQMAFASRDIAHALSTSNVSRAQDFLRQRKDELIRGEALTAELRIVLQTIRREVRDLALSEQVQDSEKIRVLEALNEQLVPLGFKATQQETSIINFPVPTQTPAE